MSEGILLLLPTPALAADPETDWWHLKDGGIVDQGHDDHWRELAQLTAGIEVIGLAPTAAVRIDRPQGLTGADRQQLGIARSQAAMASMAEPATLHAVSGLVDDRVTVAVVANGQMVEWLDWLTAQGVDPLAILPIGLIVPPSSDWTAAHLGSERMLGQGDLIVPDEPALREAIVGGAEVDQLDGPILEERLIALAETKPLNLRVGRFARRHLLVLDRARVRDLLGLLLLVPLLGLVMALVMIVRFERASDRLDAEVAAMASRASGQTVSAIAAMSALDASISRTAGATGSPFAVIAAVFQQVQQVPGSSIRQMGWRPDGTLNMTLAATRAEDLNRLLAQLQRQGYLITATTRADNSGQALADVTVRAAA